MSRYLDGPGDTASIISQNTISSTGPAAGRSIYPQGPQFGVETFASKDFIVKDFVESLSEGAAQSSRRSASHLQAFDPKPYIRTFEHALTRLGVLAGEREAHENELAQAVRRAESQHKQHCETLQTKLDEALESFNSLEERLDTSFEGANGTKQSSQASGAYALQIGERLEELDRQKRRAEDAKFLLQCWQDVSERGDLSHLEDTRRLGGGPGKVKCAQIARQLLKISDRLDSIAQASPSDVSKVPNGEPYMNGAKGANHNERPPSETREVIERFLEGLEKDLLEQFDECQRQHNEHGMRECATALYDFGEGASIIGRFVNQHEFFLERSHLTSEPVSDDSDLWERVADPDAEPPGVETSLQSLVDEVKQILQDESFTIRQVFSFHEQVLVTFLQRVFQQSIQQRLEVVLEKANNVSSLTFLRTLQATKNYMGAMVEELKSHGLTEHPDAASALVAATLDQQVEDLFIPYLTGSSYIDREKRSLEELYASLLFRFTSYHSKKRKNPNNQYLRTLSQRGREALASAKDVYTDRLNSSDLADSQKAILLRLARVKDAEKRESADIDVSDEDGALSIPVAKRTLKWLAEAVGRGLDLGGGTETPRDISALLKLLLVHLGDIYLDTALDTANDNAVAQENNKNEPDLSFIPDIRASISILQLTLSVTSSVLLPLASSNVTVRREMEKSINATVSRMEDKISTVRTRTIDVALNWVTKLLARQNRSDFRPREDMLGISEETPTCMAIYAFLKQVRDLSSTAVEGRNMEAFFTELAIGLRSLLFEHFKKFQVNLAGGLTVSKDITKYIELLRSLPLAASFQPSMEVLVEVGNIFVIGPEALKDRLRGGGALTGIDKADLRPYIMRREDVNSIGVQSVLNAL